MIPSHTCKHSYTVGRVVPSRTASNMRSTVEARSAGSKQLGHVEAAELRTRLEPSRDAAILYTHVLCPYAQRAWLVLLEKSIPFNLVNVDLSLKPSWYTNVNPAALVPAVEWQGDVYTESLDICKWVNDTFEGPQLVPEGSKEAVKTLVRDSSKFVSAGLTLLAGANGRSWGIGSGQSESQKKAFEKELQLLSTALQKSGGPFLTGQSISLADIVYYPFVERFDVAMPVFCGYSLRSGQNSSIDAWLKALAKRESIQTCSPDASLLLGAFKKHRSLDFFDFHTYTAAALHPHLN